jgi:hypothetical protein
MHSDHNDMLMAEWAGDFNDTIRIFLEDYRRQASRARRRRALGGIFLGASAASTVFIAAWPVLKSAVFVF